MLASYGTIQHYFSKCTLYCLGRFEGHCTPLLLISIGRQKSKLTARQSYRREWSFVLVGGITKGKWPWLRKKTAGERDNKSKFKLASALSWSCRRFLDFRWCVLMSLAERTVIKTHKVQLQCTYSGASPVQR